MAEWRVNMMESSFQLSYLYVCDTRTTIDEQAAKQRSMRFPIQI